MNPDFSNPAFWHRLHFAFTMIYHYLFPQLTMGLAWFIVFWKWKALRTGEERYAQAARFWAKIFGLNFTVGVVTGIPMELKSEIARPTVYETLEPNQLYIVSGAAWAGETEVAET